MSVTTTSNTPFAASHTSWSTLYITQTDSGGKTVLAVYTCLGTQLPCSGRELGVINNSPVTKLQLVVVFLAAFHVLMVVM